MDLYENVWGVSFAELCVFFNLKSRWTNLQSYMFQILYWVFKMHFINVNFITVYSVLCKKCYVWFYTSRSLRCKYLYISAPDLHSVALLLGLNWNINEANMDISFIIVLFLFFYLLYTLFPSTSPLQKLAVVIKLFDTNSLMFYWRMCSEPLQIVLKCLLCCRHLQLWVYLILLPRKMKYYLQRGNTHVAESAVPTCDKMTAVMAGRGLYCMTWTLHHGCNVVFAAYPVS